MVINNIDYSITDFVFIDMKTVLLEDEISLSKYTDEDLKCETNKFLKPFSSRIAAISLGYVTPKGDINTKTLSNEDEQQLITDFFAIIEKAGNRKIPAMYSPQFVLPYLRSKCLYYGMDYIWNDCGLKPWEVGLENKSKLRLFDISTYHKGCSFYNTSFEDFIYSVLGNIRPTTSYKDLASLYASGHITLGEIESWSNSHVDDLIEAVGKYFKFERGGLEEEKECDVDLRVGKKDKNYDGITISLVAATGKRGSYNVQLSDNTDMVIKSKVKPKVGEDITKFIS